MILKLLELQQAGRVHRFTQRIERIFKLVNAEGKLNWPCVHTWFVAFGYIHYIALQQFSTCVSAKLSGASVVLS